MISATSLFQERNFNLTRLSCLAKGLIGKYTIVDLRNDSSVNGKIDSVDGCLNVTLVDAIFTNSKGDEFFFDLFFVRERNVRYIHIPREISVMDTIVSSLNAIRFPKLNEESRGMSRKKSRLMERQLETKKRVQEILQEKQRRKALENQERRN
ncbi:U7 snRNA-associated Sm-like protein LSm10 [Cimex lectularius]|uniref:Sm domain-containing protein n=1 Tax=Cimex lectularius TaxID=79782 RepID=A0A8I6RTZ8_CIMLE|nr:U7 snRNA-associated Sm-like protein LSm10 [Cimex lectularius]